MTDQEKKVLQEAGAKYANDLKNAGVNVVTREKAWQSKDVAKVTISETTLIAQTAEDFEGREWRRVNGLGISLTAFCERGCILDKDGHDLTSGQIPDTLCALIEASGKPFKDGETIDLKVKAVVPVLRAGRLAQRIVWQLA